MPNYFTLSVNIDAGHVVLQGPFVIFYPDTGKDLFEGTLEDLEISHPEVISQLLHCGAIKRTSRQPD